MMLPFVIYSISFFCLAFLDIMNHSLIYSNIDEGVLLTLLHCSLVFIRRCKLAKS